MRKLINPWRERGDLDEWDEDEFYERILVQNRELKKRKVNGTSSESTESDD